MTDIAWFRRVQDEQIARLEQQRSGSAQHLRDDDAIQLFGTIGSDGVLKADGSVIITSFDDKQNSVPTIALGLDRISALVLGSRRVPEVATLLPTRGPNATSCERCAGSGAVDGGVLCPNCGGLGWISPQV